MRIDNHTQYWIEDRIENREPLLWLEFIRFMKSLGASKSQLERYRSKQYKKLVMMKYKKAKESPSPWWSK